MAFALMSHQGSCSEMNSKPKWQLYCNLVHIKDAFIMIIISVLLLRDSPTDRTQVEQPARCNLLHENYHNNTQSCGKEAKGGACKWHGNERRLQAQSSCHNTGNNNNWNPLKPFTLNRSTSPCKEQEWEALKCLILPKQSQINTGVLSTSHPSSPDYNETFIKSSPVLENNYLSPCHLFLLRLFIEFHSSLLSETFSDMFSTQKETETRRTFRLTAGDRFNNVLVWLFEIIKAWYSLLLHCCPKNYLKKRHHRAAALLRVTLFFIAINVCTVFWVDPTSAVLPLLTLTTGPDVCSSTSENKGCMSFCPSVITSLKWATVT